MWYKINALEPKFKMKIHFWLWAANRGKLNKMLKEKDITDIQSIAEEPKPYFEWKAGPLKTL